MALRRADKGYVLGVTGQHPFWSWGAPVEVFGTADEIAGAWPVSAWRRLSADAGTMIGSADHPSPQGCGRGRPRGGLRLHDWAYLELATLPANAVDPALDGSIWTRGLLIRRSLADASLALFTTWCPAGTSVKALVAVEDRRWAIEDAFETAKTELGLAHNETRSWHGWHRHVSLVMLAFAMLIMVRHRTSSISRKSQVP